MASSLSIGSSILLASWTSIADSLLPSADLSLLARLDIGTIATSGFNGSLSLPTRYLCSAPAQILNMTSLRVHPMMDLSWRTRSNSNMVAFHFLEAEIIPLNGVAGAVNGAVGMSLSLIHISEPTRPY